MAPSSTLQPQWSRLTAAAAALAVALVATSVLAGWILDVAVLKGFFGDITMKANTALAFLTGAASIGALLVRARIPGVSCAVLTTAIGGATLFQHLSGLDLGIDQLIFVEEPGAPATSSPNRMGPNASSNFLLAGTALFLLFRDTPRSIAWAQRLAFGGSVLALLAIAGYVNGATQLYAISQYTGIALHTAVALLVLQVGILCARVDHGPMALLADDGVAGMLLRRLVAPIIFIPLLLGHLVGLGRELSLFDRGLSLALLSVTVIVVFGWIVWQTTRSIFIADSARRRAEHDRDQLLVRERHARDEAERANRLKDHFIAVLSHELRTPLNVMLGWIQMIENEPAPERHARASAIVARNGRVLTRLVEDLLDMSRATAGQFEIARLPTAFATVVQNAVDAFAPRAREKRVDLRIRVTPGRDVVDGDAERLQQIVSNLLSNAIKFTPPGGTVDVSTACEGHEIVLTVADTGVGFDPSFNADLFEPFRQADSSTKREHGGLGLGLSIARHIAELHGGALTGHSPGKGRGATFTLRLPVAPGARTAAGPGMGTAAASASPDVAAAGERRS